MSEQLVTGEKETSGNTELGGEEDPSMHEGGEIAPSGLTEFDNNLVGVGKFSGERKGEKDVLASLSLMEEMTVNQCMAKRRKNEEAELIAEKAVLKVNGANKIRELYRIMNEIPESYKEKELRIKQEVEKEWGEWNNVLDVLSADEVDPLVGLRFKFGKLKIYPGLQVN